MPFKYNPSDVVFDEIKKALREDNDEKILSALDVLTNDNFLASNMPDFMANWGVNYDTNWNLVVSQNSREISIDDVKAKLTEFFGQSLEKPLEVAKIQPALITSQPLNKQQVGQLETEHGTVHTEDKQATRCSELLKGSFSGVSKWVSPQSQAPETRPFTEIAVKSKNGPGGQRER